MGSPNISSPYLSPIATKACAALLCVPHRRDHFLLTCVLSLKEHADAVNLISHWTAPYPYEARWHVVAGFIAALLPVLPLLKMSWVEERYCENSRKKRKRAAGADEAAVEETEDHVPASSTRTLRPADVTAAMCDPLFQARCHAVAALNRCLETFAHWSGGCECHGDVVHRSSDIIADGSMKLSASKQRSHHQERRLLSSLLRRHSMDAKCVMAGRRAPELASGRLDGVVHNIFSEGVASFLEHVGNDAAELKSLLQDFNVAKLELVGILKLKLSFWSELPWCLAGVASTDATVAQDCASTKR